MLSVYYIGDYQQICTLPVSLPPWHSQFDKFDPVGSRWTHRCHTGFDTTRGRWRGMAGGGGGGGDLWTYTHFYSTCVVP